MNSYHYTLYFANGTLTMGDLKTAYHCGLTKPIMITHNEWFPTYANVIMMTWYSLRTFMTSISVISLLFGPSLVSLGHWPIPRLREATYQWQDRFIFVTGLFIPVTICWTGGTESIKIKGRWLKQFSREFKSNKYLESTIFTTASLYCILNKIMFHH